MENGKNLCGRYDVQNFFERQLYSLSLDTSEKTVVQLARSVRW